MKKPLLVLALFVLVAYFSGFFDLFSSGNEEADLPVTAEEWMIDSIAVNNTITYRFNRNKFYRDKDAISGFVLQSDGMFKELQAKSGYSSEVPVGTFKTNETSLLVNHTKKGELHTYAMKKTDRRMVLKRNGQTLFLSPYYNDYTGHKATQMRLEKMKNGSEL
jgi:hypothetical protein